MMLFAAAAVAAAADDYDDLRDDIVSETKSELPGFLLCRL